MIDYMRDSTGLERDTNVKMCQDIADSLDKGVSIDAIIIDFSKIFNFVPHVQLLMKLVDMGVDLRVAICLREFLVGHT